MSNPAIPDELLLDRFQRGDKAAFQDLVERYKDGVVGYIHRMVADPAWAEDLAQDVFLRLFVNAGNFRAKSRFSTWLFRIAHNRAMDFIKRKRIEPKLVLNIPDPGGREQEADVPDGGDSPPDESQRREAEEGILGVVGGMEEKYRTVFVLCAMERMSYEDAADVTGLSVKTVSSRLCRARKLFRARAKPWLDAAI